MIQDKIMGSNLYHGTYSVYVIATIYAKVFLTATNKKLLNVVCKIIDSHISLYKCNIHCWHLQGLAPTRSFVIVKMWIKDNQPTIINIARTENILFLF